MDTEPEPKVTISFSATILEAKLLLAFYSMLQYETEIDGDIEMSLEVLHSAMQGFYDLHADHVPEVLADACKSAEDILSKAEKAWKHG